MPSPHLLKYEYSHLHHLLLPLKIYNLIKTGRDRCSAHPTKNAITCMNCKLITGFERLIPVMHEMDIFFTGQNYIHSPHS